MRFFDAHCDTILQVIEEGRDFFAGPGLHVTLEGLRRADVRAQVFACFVLEARYPGRAREQALTFVQAVRDLCAAHPDDLLLADTPVLVASAFADAQPVRRAVVLALEGADPLEGEVAALREFRRLGVRLLTLAWDDNPFCGTAFGSGGGLTPKGEELVALCEELGVVVDVSHASDAAFDDVCRVATRPFVASHSNCRALCDVERNLSDEMIRALAERGGVMGINLASGFLLQEVRELERAAMREFWAAVRSGEKTLDEARKAAAAAVDLPRPPLDLVAAHVRHAMDVGGEDCVGLGGDLDGVEGTPEGMDGVADYPRIAAVLRAAGLSERQVEKVCFRNFARLFGASVP